MAEDPLKNSFLVYVKKKRRDALLFLVWAIIPAMVGTVLFFWLLWWCCTQISESPAIQGLLFGVFTATLLFVGYREYSKPPKIDRDDDDNLIPGVSHTLSWRFTSNYFSLSSPLEDLTGNIISVIPTLLFQLVFSMVSTFSLFQSAEISDQAFKFLPREKEYLGRDDLESHLQRDPRKTKKALFLLCKIRFLKMIRRENDVIFRRTMTFDDFLDQHHQFN